MDKVKVKLYEYLYSLYVPKAKKYRMGQLQHQISKMSIRHISKSDAGRVNVQVLIVKTKGKGTRSSFDDYEVKLADFDSNIGKRYAYAYIHDFNSLGYLKRLDITSVKTLILSKTEE